MALVLSLNCKNYHKPLSLRNPNCKFNHSQLSVQFSDNHSVSSSSTSLSHTSLQGWKLRRRFRVFNNSGEDPAQSASEDNEENSLGVKAALSMLRFYKREISPLLPRSCRYVPTCSEYSMIAYKKYGVVKGTILTAWRLCRCNPLGGSGFDPPRWFDEPSPPQQ
ncbi:hypothetical protein CDL12_22706 [Handroanthus impetiginosus]|uniref:Membrane protein insertion efficiency factor n=1 Tax=Handroanthus impetiginosus TaxID=429701 RepID=A0A2G9GHK3_9LAMI|nr:hypothetical protein CDL12_22706 [Handroanthus impetiginosus]